MHIKKKLNIYPIFTILKYGKKNLEYTVSRCLLKFDLSIEMHIKLLIS